MFIRPLQKCDFEKVIELGNDIQGQGYLSENSLEDMFLKGFKNGINAHAVAICDNNLVGFRITYSPGCWDIDAWCSPELWGVDKSQVCYFKTNNVLSEWRGRGIGQKLLQHSIEAVQKQGALAGVAHIWKESPNNSSVRYFTKAGGRLVYEYPNRWSWKNYDPEYMCSRCGGNCHCTACEMLLEFK